MRRVLRATDGDRGAPAAARRRPRGAARGGRGGPRAAPRADARRRARSSSAGARPARPPSDLHRRFGDDAIFVLVREQSRDLVLTADLGRLLGLEGCLSGNLPPGRRSPAARAGRARGWRATKPVQVVFGPGDVHQRGRRPDPGPVHGPAPAARRRRPSGRRRRRAGSRCARGARAPSADRLARRREPARLRAVRCGDRSSSPPSTGSAASRSLDDPSFVSHARLRPERRPRARPRRASPTCSRTRQRPRPGPAAARAVDGRPRPGARRSCARPSRCRSGGWPRARYTVTGAPVVLQDLTTSISPTRSCACSSPRWSSWRVVLGARVPRRGGGCCRSRSRSRRRR